MWKLWLSTDLLRDLKEFTHIHTNTDRYTLTHTVNVA